MGKYDEALSKSLEKGRTDWGATERLGNVAGEQLYGPNAVVRRQAVIARNRGRVDHAERLEKSLGKSIAVVDNYQIHALTDKGNSMEKSLRALEAIAKGEVPVQTESREDELDRLRRENRVLKQVIQRKKTKSKA